jgi:O-antigen ligase
MNEANTQPLARIVHWVPFFDNALFFLLFSGPPSFRHRDSEASLYREIDWAIVFQLVVWGVAGVWVYYRFWRARPKGNFWALFTPTHKIAAVLIVLLWTSTFVSIAPSLTAVKVCQVTIEMLFCWTFLRLYGVERCLNRIFWGSTVLCIAIAAAALVVPDYVIELSDMGFPRLRGGNITGTNVVSAFAIILLLTHRRQISKAAMALGLVFFSVLQFLSLTRTSWIALAVIFLIATLRRPRIKGMKWIYATVLLGVLASLAGGYSKLAAYRDPDSVYELSSRLGLWAYMSDAVLKDSPWLGLGYTAATRQLGLEFNPNLGSGHSIFFDVFIGGGLLSLAVFLLLFLVLGYHSMKLLRRTTDATAFAISGLFFYVLIMGSMGETIDTSPFGFTFWMIVSMLPIVTARLSPNTLSQVGTSLPPMKLAHSG